MSDVELIAELRKHVGSVCYSGLTSLLREAADRLESLSKPSPTRNATIEECAAVADAVDGMGELSDFAAGIDCAAQKIAEAIRNLKSLPPSPSVNEGGI